MEEHMEKAMAKALERKNVIFGNLFMKIMEIRRKRKVKGNMLHLRRKMKENNRKMKKIEATLIKRLLRLIFVGCVLYSFHD